MSEPDVPASRLRRGQLAPAAARLRYISVIHPDAEARCQICGNPAPIHVLEPVVDRANGQRISIALCDPCVNFAFAMSARDQLEQPEQPRRRRRPRR